MPIQGILHYDGVGFDQSVKVNYTATSNPTVNDDSTQGYAVGSVWLNITAATQFTCTSAAVGAAVWIRVVKGPATSTNTAIARFSGTAGNVILNSSVTIDGSGNVNVPAAGLYQINGIRANVAFAGYDAVGGQSFDTTPIIVNIDTTFFTPNASAYTLASDEVTVKIAGRYLVRFDVAMLVATSTSTARAWLEKNGSEVTGTTVYATATTGNVATSGACQVVLDLVANDVLRISAVRSAGTGTLTTAQNGSRLTITRLT